jgi:hypothetical protein
LEVITVKYLFDHTPEEYPHVKVMANHVKTQSICSDTGVPSFKKLQERACVFVAVRLAHVRVHTSQIFKYFVLDTH